MKISPMPNCHDFFFRFPETPYIRTLNAFLILGVFFLLHFSFWTGNGPLTQNGTIAMFIIIGYLVAYAAAQLWLHWFFYSYDSYFYLHEKLIWVNLSLIIITAIAIPTTIIHYKVPLKKEMKDYLYQRITAHPKRIPYILEVLQAQKKCCGIYDYKDYFQPDWNVTIGFPVSCCNNESHKFFRNCITNGSDYSVLHQKGCFIDGYYKGIEGTYLSALVTLTDILLLGATSLPFFTVVVIQFIIYKSGNWHIWPCKRKKEPLTQPVSLVSTIDSRDGANIAGISSSLTYSQQSTTTAGPSQSGPRASKRPTTGASHKSQLSLEFTEMEDFNPLTAPFEIVTSGSTSE